MGDCEIDPNKLRAMALVGRHEDRWQALEMGMWALHDWTSMVVPEAPHQPKVQKADWQASDVSLDKMMDQWESRFDELLDSP